MDRRTYRGNMGSNHCNNRRTAPYRSNDPVCGDVLGYSPEYTCDRDDYHEDFDRFPLAMCYVPWQQFRNLFENDFEALCHGTLFKELNLDWYGRSCKQDGRK